MDLSGYMAASLNNRLERHETETIVRKSTHKRMSAKSFAVEKAKA